MDETPEMASVVAFAGGIVSGLVRDRVFVSVMLRYDAVAFRRVQNRPASEVAVEEGSVTALNPELVM